jgi:hypothetical protein
LWQQELVKKCEKRNVQQGVGGTDSEIGIDLERHPFTEQGKKYVQYTGDP